MNWPKAATRPFLIIVFILFAGLILHLTYAFNTTPILYQAKPRPHTSPEDGGTEKGSSHGDWEFDPKRDADNYGLDEQQCRSAFPLLFGEIDKVVTARKGKKITFDELNSRENGPAMVRAIIHEGDLHVLHFGDMGYTFSRAKATLHSLNRALTADPDRKALPNIEFIFQTDDWSNPPEPVWTYSKQDGDDWAWLMPDFGYWSWPETKVGSYSSVRQRIAAIDEGGVINGKTQRPLKFKDKERKLLWRGSLATGPELRGKLVEATEGKSWSAVQGLDWGNKEELAKSYVPIEDHCRYMFLAHVEGRSYSGRGKYLQNCRSVFVTHDLTWREVHHGAFIPTGPDANYVQVKRDFSDLDNKIHYLLEHPDVAEKIAENGVRTFRERYLTPAAEACYWRELIRTYGSMCDFEPSLYTDTKGQKPRGVPFESFVLDGKLVGDE